MILEITIQLFFSVYALAHIDTRHVMRHTNIEQNNFLLGRI